MQINAALFRDMQISVALLGTCNGSKWRDRLIPLLHDHVSYFNPVVDTWDEAAQKREDEARRDSTLRLYVITPAMKSFFTIAEVVDDSNKWPADVVFCILEEDENLRYSKHDEKALLKVKDMVANNGAYVFNSLEEIAQFLNSYGS